MLSPNTHRKSIFPAKWKNPPWRNMELKIVAQVGIGDVQSIIWLYPARISPSQRVPEVISNGINPYLIMNSKSCTALNARNWTANIKILK